MLIRIMKIVLLLLTVVAASRCPKRAETLSCFYNIADTDNDEQISRQELSDAIFGRLHWYEKLPFQLFGGIGKIMHDCDTNKDSILTLQESTARVQCMDTCYKTRNTDSLFKCNL